ncbi:MAG: hypothetical protein AAGE52_38100, partial [Myxococcota bacterium]
AYVAVFDEGFDDRRSELGAPAETPLAVVSSEVYPDANNPSAFRAEPQATERRADVRDHH